MNKGVELSVLPPDLWGRESSPGDEEEGCPSSLSAVDLTRSSTELPRGKLVRAYIEKEALLSRIPKNKSYQPSLI